MATSYECFSCHKVFVGVTDKKCPSCGGTNGELIPPEKVKQGMEAGTFFNIDPTTGKRANRPRR
jgi:hypothetical protein